MENRKETEREAVVVGPNRIFIFSRVALPFGLQSSFEYVTRVMSMQSWQGFIDPGASVPEICYFLINFCNCSEIFWF